MKFKPKQLSELPDGDLVGMASKVVGTLVDAWSVIVAADVVAILQALNVHPVVVVALIGRRCVLVRQSLSFFRQSTASS